MTRKTLIDLARELQESRAEFIQLEGEYGVFNEADAINFETLRAARTRYHAALTAWNAQCPPDPPKPPKGLRWVRLKPEA